MKRNVLKMAFVMIMMTASLGVYAQRPQFTVCNCDSTSYSCVYVVTTTVTACNAVPTCIGMSITYTVHPGHCQGFVFTPPPGYTVNLSSVNFHVTNLANSSYGDFGPSTGTNFSWGNCHGSTGGDVTTFTGNGTSTYTVCADLITGKPGRQPSNTTNSKVLAKSGVLGEGSGQKFFNIYPNPSSGDVTLNFALDQPDDAGIEVYNSFHEKVYSFKKRVEATENNKLQVEGLPPGIYVVVFTTGHETTTQKFIVKP